MSIFSGLKSYAGKYIVKSVEAMSEEDKALVREAVVMTSQFGLSCCFMMKAGNMHFIPMEKDAPVDPGLVLDLNHLRLVTLSKDGEADIVRVRP